MSAIPKSVQNGLRNIRFQMHMEELSQSCWAADRGLKDQYMNAESVVRERFGLAPGEEFEYSDDPEYSGPDFGEEVGEEEHVAQLARTLLRPTFLIAFYHLWERHAASWLGILPKEFKHEKAVELLVQRGASLDKDRLDEVNLAANCAKHGPGNSAEKLFDRRPDLFRPGTTRETADAENLMISDAVLRGMVAVLRTATP